MLALVIDVEVIKNNTNFLAHFLAVDIYVHNGFFDCNFSR